MVWVLCDRCSRVFGAFLSAARKFCSRRCRDAAKAFSPKRFWERVDRRGPNECWLWLGGHDTKDGYGRAFDGKRTRQAHDVAWELANKRKVPRGKLIRHSCDNPPCCNPKHLLCGTSKDNYRDAEERGRNRIPYVHTHVPLHRRPRGDRNGMRLHPEAVLRGERNGNSKLTRRKVEAIRRVRRETRLSYPKLAQRFGTSTSQAHRIVKGDAWKERSCQR